MALLLINLLFLQKKKNWNLTTKIMFTWKVMLQKWLTLVLLWKKPLEVPTKTFRTVHKVLKQIKTSNFLLNWLLLFKLEVIKEQKTNSFIRNFLTKSNIIKNTNLTFYKLYNKPYISLNNWVKLIYFFRNDLLKVEPKFKILRPKLFFFLIKKKYWKLKGLNNIKSNFLYYKQAILTTLFVPKTALKTMVSQIDYFSEIILHLKLNFLKSKINYYKSQFLNFFGFNIIYGSTITQKINLD